MKKNKEVREGREEGRAGHDALIDRASDAGQYGSRTDAYAEGVGYLGMDDIDRLRREKLKKQTQ